MKKHHYLKIFETYFDDVVSKTKTFETRFNDRNYQVGDLVTLMEGYLTIEGDGFKYSGRRISAEIGYISDFGVADGFVTFSLVNIGIMIIEDENED